MITIIGLSIALILYFNLVLYLHLKDLTNVYSLRDYFKFNGGINITMNATFLFIVIVVVVLKYVR